MFFKSIRFTLTLWYSVTLAIILVLFCSFLYLTIKKQLYQEVDQEILTIAEALASPTLEPFRNSAPLVFDQVLEDFLGPKAAGKYVQLFDSAGRVTSRSKNLQDVRLPLSGDDLRDASLGNVTYDTAQGVEKYPIRTITLPVFSDGKFDNVVRVGASLKNATVTLDKIRLIILILIPASLLLLSYGGWFLAGRALKPVDLITKSAQKISAENMSHRLEVVNPGDEIGRLAAAFNDTLARLENSFNRTRQFSTDVSHELRTPLTILRGGTEVGLKWAKEPEEFRELFRSNLEEIHRMTEIIEYLLDQSRADEGVLPLHLEELDLRDTINDLVQQLRLLSDDKGVSLVFEGDKSVCVRGDRLRLRQMFLNLLDNALKYTPAGGAIRVQLDCDASQAWVAVIDTGPGIAAEHLPYLFDRFYRVDKARNREHGGSGLGLALVRAFAEAHGGKVDVMSEVGKGSVFTVHLPLLK
ncbi:MAG TPA: heavy metal sensor histidine kinase [Geobacteraceae bacterium]